MNDGPIVGNTGGKFEMPAVPSTSETSGASDQVSGEFTPQTPGDEALASSGFASTAEQVGGTPVFNQDKESSTPETDPNLDQPTKLEWHLAEMQYWTDQLGIEDLTPENVVSALQKISVYNPSEITTKLQNFQTSFKENAEGLVDNRKYAEAVKLVNLLLAADLEQSVNQEVLEQEVAKPPTQEAAKTPPTDPEVDSEPDPDVEDEQTTSSETSEKSKMEEIFENSGAQGNTVAEKYASLKNKPDQLKAIKDSMTPEEWAGVAAEILDAVATEYEEKIVDGQEDPEARKQLESLIEELGQEALEKKKKQWGETLSELIKGGMDGSDMDLFIQALILGNTSGGRLTGKFGGLGKEGEANSKQVGIKEYKEFISWSDSESREDKMKKWLNPMILVLQKMDKIDSNINIYKADDNPSVDQLKRMMRDVYEVFAKEDLAKINEAFGSVSENKPNEVSFNWNKNSSMGQEMAIMIELLSKHDSAINALFGNQEPT